jgi:Na+-transporting methylmalonyl-CoA/oxaloacetate decarboxylase gamma subunit
MKNSDPTFLEKCLMTLIVAIVLACAIWAVGAVITSLDLEENVPGPSLIDM